MEFRKIVPLILHAGQQRRRRYKEQTFELCWKRRGWDNLREQHQNICITICNVEDQCKFDV